MSSWAKKLDTKLDGLADGASKESIQTLANWIAFNRKHATTIATVLTQRLQDNRTNPKRQWLYWQVLHEVLITDHGTAGKWEKLLVLRETVGEALIPTMEVLASNLPPPDSMDPYIKEWAELSVFGGPSMLAQIRRLYQSRNQAVSTTEEQLQPQLPSQPLVTEEKEMLSPSIPTDLPLKDEGTSKQSIQSVAVMTESSSVTADSKIEATSPEPVEASAYTATTSNDNNEGDASPLKQPQQKRSSFSHLKNADVEYDFDSKGVPYGKVESREFLDPCKAITSLQIARDVRTNSAVEISMALTNLPDDIQQSAESMASGTLSQLDTASINDYSIRIPSTLLDLDIGEELVSLRVFQDIVQRQKMAREKLIYLLLKSRCQFGSTDAARDYNQMDTVVLKKLQKRKQMLSDALELEGLDTSQIADDEEEEMGGKNSKGKKKKVTKEKEELPPLAWYKPDGDDEIVAAPT